MIFQIVSLILESIFGLLTAACLLRLYMQYQRIPLSARAGNPIGRFIFALSDWLVLPLRRILPAMGRVDTASLVAAYLLQMVQFLLLWLLSGAVSGLLLAAPLIALFGLIKLVIMGLIVLVILSALASWLSTSSALSDLIDRLCAPILAPLRRIVPLVGGVDLSPLVLLLLLQVALILLNSLHSSLLR